MTISIFKKYIFAIVEQVGHIWERQRWGEKQLLTMYLLCFLDPFVLKLYYILKCSSESYSLGEIILKWH